MFQTARIKLTVWYLLIIMVISVAFSLAAYNRFHRELGRLEFEPQRFERRLFLFPDPEIFLEIRRRLATSLILINATILVLAGILGYWLAGKTLRPIKDMVDEQNRFITDASHELKTPLTSLKTAFEVYLRNKKLPPAKLLVKESLIEVNKLQKLTEGLLTLSHELPVSLVKVNLLGIITAALQRVKPMADDKKINLRVDKNSWKILGNADQLTDLMVIFLDNAIKYSPSGSEIKIKTEKRDGKALIKIVDQGIGIAPKDQAHIFDRFYQADIARARYGKGGYGLGLAIAKKIVTAHHGSISVTSQIGRGTTFQLSFSLIN